MWQQCVGTCTCVWCLAECVPNEHHLSSSVFHVGWSVMSGMGTSDVALQLYFMYIGTALYSHCKLEMTGSSPVQGCLFLS